MRLFLSSQHFGDHIDYLLKLVGNNKKVAYIANAKDAEPVRRKEVVEEHREVFKELGFEFEELDLRDYFGERKITQKDLAGFGLVWASGGVSYLLRRAFYDSAFDKVLLDLLEQDQLVYGGSSAGSVVMCPRLNGYKLTDNYKLVKEIYKEEEMNEGLSLIPFQIVPHANSETMGDKAKIYLRYFKDNDIDYLAMSDGQVYVVDGQKRALLK